MCSDSEAGSYLRLIDFVSLNPRLESNNEEEEEEEEAQVRETGAAHNHVFGTKTVFVCDQTLMSWPSTSHPKTSTTDPKNRLRRARWPSTLNPDHYAPNPKPSTPHPKLYTLNPEPGFPASAGPKP